MRDAGRMDVLRCITKILAQDFGLYTADHRDHLKISKL